MSHSARSIRHTGDASYQIERQGGLQMGIQLTHVTLGASDLKRSTKFYTDLGCEIANDYGVSCSSNRATVRRSLDSTEEMTWPLMPVWILREADFKASPSTTSCR